MRILVDYRPALRERTGVGEYIHGLSAPTPRRIPDEVTVFTSSWKDRLAPAVASELGVAVIDRRIPVRVLNYLWHRAEWPPVESLAGHVDVVHAAHPLLIPARARRRSSRFTTSFSLRTRNRRAPRSGATTRRSPAHTRGARTPW